MNWGLIEGFIKHEFRPKDPFIKFEDWDMDYNLILTLHNLRAAARRGTTNQIRIIIHENGGFSLTGHGAQSLHGAYERTYPVGLPKDPYGHLGRAADFTIEEKISGVWTPWSWLKQAVFVYSKIGPEHGLGIYPWWHQPGLHLDWRAENRERTPAVWFRTPEDEYIFRPFERFYDLVDNIRNWEEDLREPEGSGDPS